MEPDDFFHHAAQAISDLINRWPWSPTVDEIAQLIEEAWWLSQPLEENGRGTQLTNSSTLTKSARPFVGEVRSFLDN